MELVLHLVPEDGLLPFKLDATLDEVLAVAKEAGLAPSHQEPGVVYFVENAIHIEFIAGKAIFVGVAPHPDIRLIFNTRDLLRRPAAEVFDTLARRETEEHLFDDTEYVFPDQKITLWDADPQYNLTGGGVSMWGQIGVGNQRYMDAISEH